MCPDDNQKLKDEFYHDDYTREDLSKNLKKYINEFLYDKVPSTMTIGEFERLSCKIHDLIIKEWE